MNYTKTKGIGSARKIPVILQSFADELGMYINAYKKGYWISVDKKGYAFSIVIIDVSKDKTSPWAVIGGAKWNVKIFGLDEQLYVSSIREVVAYLEENKSYIYSRVQAYKISTDAKKPKSTKASKPKRKSDDSEQRGVGRVKRITGYAVVPEKVLITGVKGAKNKIMLVPEVEVNIVGRLEKNLPQIKDANSAASIIRDVMSQKYPNKIGTQEIFGYAFLNNQNQVLGIYWQAIGSQTGVVTDLGLFTSAMAATAARSVIAFHNHPSGNTQPSEADKIISKRIKALCETYTANYLDCLVLTKYGFYSFAENGIL